MSNQSAYSIELAHEKSTLELSSNTQTANNNFNKKQNPQANKQLISKKKSTCIETLALCEAEGCLEEKSMSSINHSENTSSFVTRNPEKKTREAYLKWQDIKNSIAEFKTRKERYAELHKMNWYYETLDKLRRVERNYYAIYQKTLDASLKI